jgi:alkaline phosphatase
MCVEKSLVLKRQIRNDVQRKPEKINLQICFFLTTNTVMIKKSGILVWILLVLNACSPNQQLATTKFESSEIKKPKNIILMIGDGMGLGQLTAGMYANGNRLNLEQFPVVGLQKTYSYNKLITDSAASATAIACGIKTYNAAIGVNKDTLPVKTILEEAEEHGLKTGLVATSTVVHATPASFITHRPFRSMYELIAEDFLKIDIDLFIGGGRKFFDTQRKDGNSLIPKLEAKGYTVTGNYEKELISLNLNQIDKLAYFTANDTPIPHAAGRDYLPLASIMAADFLNGGKQNGFFLMIEGSQIDWGGHSNDTKYIISEVQDFDRAIGKVLKFAKKDRETLVIVTADHETGGFAINPKSRMDSIIGAFTNSYHTGTMVPVFAYGPGSELFSGIYENTDIHKKMRHCLGFDKTNEDVNSKIKEEESN